MYVCLYVCLDDNSTSDDDIDDIIKPNRLIIIHHIHFEIMMLSLTPSMSWQNYMRFVVVSNKILA